MEKKEALAQELKKILEEVIYKLDVSGREEVGPVWKEMVDKAHELHKLVQPKHHKYMIENRGVSPDNREFYNHVHPVQDLLAFIENPNANDDPIDTTMDIEFIMKIYTRRHQHYDDYRIRRTQNGWNVEFLSIGGECDKTGHPYLYKNFSQDYVNYPKALPKYMEYLWDKCAEEGYTEKNLKEAIDEIGNWVSICEQNTPSWIG